MSEIQPAHYTQGGCHTALGDREVLASLICTEGVALGAEGGGDLAVTQRGAGANMSVDVASGNAFIEGTNVTWQGMYHVSNDATKNVVIPAANSTDDRIDIIVAQVRDAQYSGVVNNWEARAVSGTASPSPMAPTLPANSLLLATILVQNGVTTITNADITDERVYAGTCSGSGVLLDTLVFTAGGTFTKGDYPSAAAVEVEVLASGGGGGGAAAGDQSVGAGGGSGAYTRGIVPVASLGVTETITVGAGGAGGTGAAAGSAGATSSFGSLLVCAGGTGGGFVNTGAAGDEQRGGGGGAVSTAGNIVATPGQRGGHAFCFGTASVHAGDGGSTPLGEGPRGRVCSFGSFAGDDANGRGAGGAGAVAGGSAGGAVQGGDGFGGIVIVRVYG